MLFANTYFDFLKSFHTKFLQLSSSFIQWIGKAARLNCNKAARWEIWLNVFMVYCSIDPIPIPMKNSKFRNWTMKLVNDPIRYFWVLQGVQIDFPGCLPASKSLVSERLLEPSINQLIMNLVGQFKCNFSNVLLELSWEVLLSNVRRSIIISSSVAP